MNVCQYYEKILSKYSFKVSTILFDNKAKIKWERDNLMKKKIKKNKTQLPANLMLNKLKKN